ncbi:MAG TPA: hypothetical protein VKI61_08990, partial [Chitinophagaceae bacterium]|nr:hypothetical protein [Chitinophagaceae bacterium]
MIYGLIGRKLEAPNLTHMRNIFCFFLILVLASSACSGQAAQQWPKAISSDGYTIKIYQPQVESLDGNTLKTRGAFSILSPGKEDPVFGAVWATSTLLTDRDKRTAVLDNIKINEIKFAGDSNAANVTKLKALLEKEIPKWDMVLSLDQLEASIEGNGNNGSTESNALSTNPPKIIYTKKPSTLVLIE